MQLSKFKIKQMLYFSSLPFVKNDDTIFSFICQMAVINEIIDWEVVLWNSLF
jgi:hypothetical protein